MTLTRAQIEAYTLAPSPIGDLAITALDALRKRDEAYAHDERMTEQATWTMEQHRRIQWERCRDLADTLREVLVHTDCPCRSTGCVVDRARALLTEQKENSSE